MSVEAPPPAQAPRVFDTLTRQHLPIFPSDGRAVRIYCCGPTVYGPAHIGNFRTFVLQDLLRRVLEACGFPTLHVRNITDVDDKTIRQSQAEGRSLAEFTAHWRAKFHADALALNLLPPHHEPGAVGHIGLQKDLIQTLLDRGHAYRAEDGSVYFRLSSFSRYGALSRLDKRSITTGNPGSALADEYEREFAGDFALWKARRAEDGPCWWDAPWGAGRPGWHIECSAMALHYLGPEIDVHAGGVDLIFPHHENEIAQSEAATGRRFVRHWFHIAHLLVEGRKMSKSLGNLHTLDDVKAHGFSPEELRYVLLSGHYRQPLNFTWESLHAARAALSRCRMVRQRLNPAAASHPPQIPARPEAFGPFRPVLDALLDDLNTPEALGALFTILRSLPSDANGQAAAETAAALDAALWVLGLHLPHEQHHAPPPPEVEELARQRATAKQARDYATADALRARITEAGWKISDIKGGGWKLEKL